jgi:hypothetical protein
MQAEHAVIFILVKTLVLFKRFRLMFSFTHTSLKLSYFKSFAFESLFLYKIIISLDIVQTFLIVLADTLPNLGMDISNLISAGIKSHLIKELICGCATRCSFLSSYCFSNINVILSINCLSHFFSFFFIFQFVIPE